MVYDCSRGIAEREISLASRNSSEKRSFPRNLAILLALMVPALVAGGVLRQAVITASPSWRLVPDPVYPVPFDEEGAIRVTLAGDRPLFPAFTQPEFIRTDDRTFTTLFPWNWSGPRTGVFLDDLGDTTIIEVTPGTPRPFDPLAHLVPVIHISCDSTALWDPETGIYVLGNYDNCLQHGGEWERDARFEFYLPGLGAVIDEPIGLRIHGGYGRYYHQKGLRFYFDDYGSSNQLEFPFFGGGPDSFRRLVVRASRYDDFSINTNLVETLFQDLGHLGSRYRYVALYLNREYWGGYSLRERIDQEFVEHTWDVVTSDYKLIKDGDTVHGDGESWWELLASFGSVGDPQDTQWFAEVRSSLDLSSYIDWQIINMYCVAGDNGFAWNLALLQQEDHPWRFIMWDEDLLFYDDALSTNMFRFFTADGPEQWERFRSPTDLRPWTPEAQQWLTMFRTLLGNSDFRSLFRSRLEHLLAGPLAEPRLHQRIDALATEQWPEIPAHAERWQGFQADWYEGNIARTRQWVSDRRELFLAQADSFYAEWEIPATAGDPATLVINEFLADNVMTNRDEAGDFDDWVELYNTGEQTVNLTGMYLTDDLDHSTKWELPAVLLRPGEHLLVWCDNETADGPLHAGFKLGAAGEEIGLYTSMAQGNFLVDSRVYGPQSADISEGREFDGATQWVAHDPPTPGQANEDTTTVPEPVPGVLVLGDAYPNPFNPGTRLDFSLPDAGHARVRVHDVRGRLVATLVDELRPAGFQTVRWEGRDRSGQAVASGMYLARLEYGGESRTVPMTLVR